MIFFLKWEKTPHYDHQVFQTLMESVRLDGSAAISLKPVQVPLSDCANQGVQPQVTGSVVTDNEDKSRFLLVIFNFIDIVS